MRRARVRVKRSIRSGLSRAEAAYVTAAIDVHEACRCQCKVQPEDCDASRGQVYRRDLCSCECSDKSQAMSCSFSPLGKVSD